MAPSRPLIGGMMEIAITILLWVMWGLLGLLGLLLLLLHMPYQARIEAQWDDARAEGQAWLGWPWRTLGLMVSVSLEQQRLAFYFLGLRFKSWSFGELKEKRSQKPKEKEKKKKEKKERKPREPGERLHLVRTPHTGYALKLLGRWLYLRAALDGRFGFDDPCTTGQLATALSWVQMAFPSVGRQVTFDYLEPVCEGRLKLSMMVWLPRIEIGLIGFLLSRQGRTMVRHYRARPKSAHAET